MLRSAFISFYRATVRHPFYAALNLLGLSFGIAVFLVLSLYVRFESSYDQSLPRSRQIYEIASARLEDGIDKHLRYSSPGLALDAVRDAVPGVVGTRLVDNYVVLRRGDTVTEYKETLVDATFFETFDIPIVAGDRADALRPDSLILSESAAMEHFGRTDVVGLSLSVEDLAYSISEPSPHLLQPRTYIVRAVLKDMPDNSSLRFDRLRLLPPERMALYPGWNDWRARAIRTFLRLDRPETARALNDRFDAIVDSYGGSAFHDRVNPGRPLHSALRVRVVPLIAQHLADPPVRGTVMALAALGVLALAMALINYVNLATAQAGLRAREIAVRKAMGATSAMLRLHLVLESMVLSLVAVVIAFSLVELSLPLINDLGGLRLRLDYRGDALMLLLLTVAVVACGGLAGWYPAAIMAAFAPAQVLASARAPGGGRFRVWLRSSLVFAQFTSITAFLIVVFGVSAQVRYLQTSDLGFSRQGLIFTNALLHPGLSDAQIVAVRQGWSALPDVRRVTAGATPDRDFRHPSFVVELEPAALDPLTGRSPPKLSAQVYLILVEEGFFRTYRTPMLAGRDLGPSDRVGPDIVFESDAADMRVPVVINQRAVDRFGLGPAETALGRVLIYQQVHFEVIGVVEDQRFDDPTEPLRPTLFFTIDDVARQATTVVSYDRVSADVMKARMRAVWRQVAADKPLDLNTSEQTINTFYDETRRLSRLYGMGAMAVSVIGVIGLYGMAAFSTSTRSIEIAMRRVSGASRLRVAWHLVVQSLAPVVAAGLTAIPIAYVTLSSWIMSFDDRVAISPWIFLAGFGLSLLVAVLTVSGLALARASVSPGKVLRHA